MTLLPGNNVVVRTVSEGGTLTFARSVDWRGAAGDSDDVTIGFALVRETLTGASDPLFQYIFNVPFGTEITAQNHAPSVATLAISGNTLTAEVIEGQEGETCRVTVSAAGWESVTLSGIQSVDSSTTETRQVVSLVSGTVANAITAEILADALTWSGNVEYYTPANNNFGTPSGTCWAAGIDLRCVSMDSSRGGAYGQGGGTLVTSCHFIAAKHYPFTVGQTVTFTGGQTRTIVGTATSDGSSTACDMQVCTLSAAVASPITPAKIPGAWFDSAITADPYANRSGEIKGYGALGFAIHQNGRKVYPMLLQASVASSTPVLVNSVSYTAYNRIATFRNFTAATTPMWWTGGDVPEAIVGDSGGPIMFFDGTDLVLYSVFTTSTSGPSMAGAQPLIDALIAAADADAIARGSLVSPTGLTVTVAADPTL